jgi:hypothetical protein
MIGGQQQWELMFRKWITQAQPHLQKAAAYCGVPSVDRLNSLFIVTGTRNVAMNRME